MRIDKFPGVITDQDPYEIGVQGLVTGENIDLSKNHKVSRRAGYASFYAGTIAAAWGDEDTFLLVEDNTLRSLDAAGATTDLATGLAECAVLRGLRAYDDRVFWTTMTDSGVIENGVNRRWGVLKPAAFAATSTGLGQMLEGRYKIGLCYVNSRGVEGPINYALAELSGGVSIEIPDSVATLAAEDVTYIRLYLSNPDGQVLYFAQEKAVGDSETMEYSGDTTDFGVPAEANNFDNMPTDGFLEEHGGRIWTSTRTPSGGVVVYSNPYSELTDLLANFFPFTGEVTGIGSVESGLYVGTTKGVYYLNGHDPEQMVALEKMPYGMIPGTLVKADGRLIGEGANAAVLLWSSERGFCAGFPNGEAVNLTERRVGTLTGTVGAAILRRTNGQNHLLTVLRQ